VGVVCFVGMGLVDTNFTDTGHLVRGFVTRLLRRSLACWRASPGNVGLKEKSPSRSLAARMILTSAHCVVWELYVNAQPALTVIATSGAREDRRCQRVRGRSHEGTSVLEAQGTWYEVNRRRCTRSSLDSRSKVLDDYASHRSLSAVALPEVVEKAVGKDGFGV